MPEPNHFCHDVTDDTLFAGRLILCFRHSDAMVVDLEFRKSLAGLIGENTRRNRLAIRCAVLRCDGRAMSESVAMGACNPWYGDRKTGRLNRDAQAVLC